MHFRFRNNLIQVIRTTYDPATKKPRAEIVARLPLDTREPAPELLSACTPAEVEEVRRWVTGHLKARAVAAEHAARTLAEQMERAGDWFSATEDTESARQIAAEAQQQWLRLRQQWRRAGLLD